MKGLVLYHPWAHFTMPAQPGRPARKRLETRGQPIGGLVGATGRQLPGCKAQTGERVAIIVGRDRRAMRAVAEGDGASGARPEDERTMMEELHADGITCEDDLPWGAVIGTARLGNAMLMTDLEGTTDHCQPHLLVGTRHDPERLLACWPSSGSSSDARGHHEHFEWGTEVVTDQRPYGVFFPGRWATELDDPVRLMEPVPIRGRQGLHVLRDTEDTGTECPRCVGRMLTTSHEEEHDWCPRCGWVDD